MNGTKQAIAKAWERFVTMAVLDDDLVPEPIYESWKRCKAAKIDPYESGRIPIMSEHEIEALRSKNRPLITLARPFMENLYNFVSGSGFLVILSDKSGYIMEVLGDEDTYTKGLTIDLVPGSQWAEDVAGTNGIGTALVLVEPLQVSGEEHYCQAIHGWTCSAAPIQNDEGEILGVLQMSGPSYSSHKHTLGMVVAAVKAVEEQLHVQQKNRQLILVNNRMNNVFRTMSDGVVIVDPMGNIEHVNPAAERILAKTRQQLDGVHIESVLKNTPGITDILQSGKSFSNIEVMSESEKSHIHCLISGEAIKNDRGDYMGGAIIINPINKIKKLVNRFSGAEARFEFRNIIGGGDELQEAIRIASLAAENDSNVLLEGESGTGKEVFAQAIHNASRRRGGPFVALNCAAIPRELMGSELFGYIEGAFTGAYRGGRPGKFELASGGTLFLDEIGDMNQGKQGALLRAIQEKKIVRIGDDKVIPVDVRIICATNKNLRATVEKGNFREDLYYRLNVITIKLPPLRSHKEDIPQLFEYFLKEISQRLSIGIDAYDPGIITALQRYEWPGNARELQNVVERMVCIARDNFLQIHDLPPELLAEHARPTISQPEAGAGLSVCGERQRRKQHREERECLEIVELLGACGGNITQVAQRMGVSRNTIYRKIRQYNIEL